ncbi:MAG: hypothetical protein IT270_04805 [Saprospiraceae bacterium]|nr:hypothetical protein [Saprospiraceae bacterium]
MRHLLLLCLVVLTQTSNAQRTWNSEVKNHLDRPTLFVNGKPQTPLMYALSDAPGGRWSWEEINQHNIRQFYADGIRLFQLDLALSDLWLPSGDLDLTLAERQINGLLEVAPEAMVFLRLHVDAPEWWLKKHPEETVAYGKTVPHPDLTGSFFRRMEADPRAPIRVSLASVLWQNEAGVQVAAFCKNLSKNKSGRQVVGIQVAGGVYGEWHQWGFLKWEADSGPAMTRHFQSWLRNQYPEVQELKKAWNDPLVTYYNATVPDSAARAQTGAGNFRLPSADQRVIDYYRCQHEMVPVVIEFFAKQVKKNWNRPVAVGAFYGYFFSVFNRQAAGGHLEPMQLLGSPWIDFLAGPQAYEPQAGLEMGEPYRSRALLHSVRLHGKLWFDEMDQQPKRNFEYLGGNWDNRRNNAVTQSDNAAMLRRNLGFALTQGIGMWLYDFGGAGLDLRKDHQWSGQHGKTGYWDDPLSHAAIREAKQLYDSLLQQPFQSTADVLVVFDTEVYYHTRSTFKNVDSVSLQAVDHTILALQYTGAAYDAVYLDDLMLVDMTPYQAVIFANTFLLDTVELRYIRSHAAGKGRHLFWVYAPGYCNGDTADIVLTEQACGFKLRPLTEWHSSRMHYDEHLGDTAVARLWGYTSPLFAVDDPVAQSLAWFDQDGLSALAYKPDPKGTGGDWFLSVPVISAPVWRELLRRAGAHMYTSESGHVVYTGNGLLVFHTKKDGKHLLMMRNWEEVEVGKGTTVLRK